MSHFINIGYGNIVSTDRIVAIVAAESAPIKRLINKAKENSELIDATQGRKTRGVIITDNHQVILSALQPETMASRLMTSKEERS
ncbi:hypothetical protein CS063_04370 [Sporanaerobium hydrogeniformans]|uniref:Uncharacterized protein n=1 Tax=Sporanaerobium hydrogeniformans TaxID=3072179 RepID=A0AC61DGU1_9FIRM|nr:DUF370 domain-containing protein [Sporanaerobium hydrogeniformans]PHV71797.1 hypothetical protein CS063_04370 [Sporanaerobium hydrogeniformans]